MAIVVTEESLVSPSHYQLLYTTLVMSQIFPNKLYVTVGCKDNNSIQQLIQTTAAKLPVQSYSKHCNPGLDHPAQPLYRYLHPETPLSARQRLTKVEGVSIRTNTNHCHSSKMCSCNQNATGPDKGVIHELSRPCVTLIGHKESHFGIHCSRSNVLPALELISWQEMPISRSNFPAKEYSPLRNWREAIV